MDLLARIARRRELQRRRAWPVGKGSVATTDLAWGHDLSEFAPDADYGQYLATSNDIYAVAQARARLVTAARLRFYAGSGSEKIEKADSRAAQLYQRVNEHWTAERLERMDELSMCIWGHTAWAIEPARGGEPDQIWWLKPSRLKPVPDESKYLKGFLYEPLFGEPPIAFNADEIVWFRYPNPLDEFAPLSPLAAARLAADTSSAMSKANRNLFENGLMAGGIIVPTDDRVVFEQHQAEDLERQFAVRMKGVDNAHRWAVLRYAAQVQGLNVSPKDAEFVAGLNLTFRQVCRAYGMQSALAGDLEHATLANATVFERVEWSRTLVT
jgi:HK97 family phage portal protein